MALLFSFGTTYVSYRRTSIQDLHSSRQELRGLLQRLASLPKENADLAQKFANDPTSMGALSGYIGQENTLLTRQAAEMARTLPRDLLSGVEYYSIALGLQSSNDFTAAKEFLGYAVQAATDFNTRVSVLRSTGQMHFMQGRTEAGRGAFKEALNVHSTYSDLDSFTRATTDIQTELAWAFSEANVNERSLAMQHIANARSLADSLSQNNMGSQSFQAQVSQAERLIAIDPLPR